MSDIFSLSVEDLAAKIRDAQITSVEVCELYIERIKKFDKDIKAWAHFDKKLLLEKQQRLTITEEQESLWDHCMVFQLR